MRKYERFLYNLKADLRFYRELLLGTPWVEREENKNKKKPCLFIRLLDCISSDTEETGRNMDKIMDRDVKAHADFNKKLGLPPEANNGCRFL